MRDVEVLSRQEVADLIARQIREAADLCARGLLSLTEAARRAKVQVWAMAEIVHEMEVREQDRRVRRLDNRPKIKAHTRKNLRRIREGHRKEFEERLRSRKRRSG